MIHVLIVLALAAPQETPTTRVAGASAPVRDGALRVDRRGDGTTTVDTPAGPITVITKTMGRSSEPEGPAALTKLSLKEVKELLDERRKVKDEWT